MSEDNNEARKGGGGGGQQGDEGQQQQQVEQLRAYLKVIEGNQKELEQTLATKRGLASAARRLSTTTTTRTATSCGSNSTAAMMMMENYAETIETLENELDDTKKMIRDLKSNVYGPKELAIQEMELIDPKGNCLMAQAGPIGGGRSGGANFNIFSQPQPATTTTATATATAEEWDTTVELDVMELDAFDLDLPDPPPTMRDGAAAATAYSSFAPPESNGLLDAAMRNDVGDICWLVEKIGVHPSYANPMNQSALHVAALWGNVEALQQLLEYSPDVNKQNFISGATPLHSITATAKTSDIPRLLECMTLLLEKGADPTLQDLFGKTAAQYCLPSNPTTRPLLNKLQPQPPLFQAIDVGDVNHIRQQLLSSLAESNRNIFEEEEKSYLNKSPLVYTVDRILEEAETTTTSTITNTNDNNQQNLLPSLLEILKMIVKDQYGKATKAQVAGGGGGGGGDGKKKKTKAEGDSAADDNDKPPLLSVCETLQTLYAEEEEDNNNSSQQQQQQQQQQGEEEEEEEEETQKQKRRRQQQHSKRTGDTITILEEVCRFLVPVWPGGGAQTDSRMVRLFHTACRKNDLKQAKLFLELIQMNPNIRLSGVSGGGGMTALHFAARSGCTDMVRYLLQFQCPTTITISDGTTKLLPGVVDISITNENGKTALDLARINRRHEVVSILEQHGDDSAGASSKVVVVQEVVVAVRNDDGDGDESIEEEVVSDDEEEVELEEIIEEEIVSDDDGDDEVLVEEEVIIMDEYFTEEEVVVDDDEVVEEEEDNKDIGPPQQKTPLG